MQIRGKIVNAVQSLYTSVSCAVKVNENLTDWFDINVGVKQGRVLSPTLFFLSISMTWQRILMILNVILILTILWFHYCLYVNGIVLIADNESVLQTMLNVVCKLCKTKPVSLYAFYCGSINILL